MLNADCLEAFKLLNLDKACNQNVQSKSKFEFSESALISLYKAIKKQPIFFFLYLHFYSK